MSKDRRHSKNRWIVAVLAALCVCGAAVLVVLALGELKERQSSTDAYASLSELSEEAREASAEPELTQEAIVAQILRQRAQAPGGSTEEAAAAEEPTTEAGEGRSEAQAAPGEPDGTSGETAEAGGMGAASEGAEGSSDSGEDGGGQAEVSDEEIAQALETVRIRPTSMDFSAIRKKCPDAVGWIRIEDTVIDYPIVQGSDNDYYLHHLADRTANASGAIMMETMNDPLWRDMATTLHGHHMRSGAMFGGLSRYGDEDYYEAHPTVRVFTPLGDYEAQIFAACVIDPNTFRYPIYLTEEEFDAMVRQTRADSAFRAPVDVRYGDQLLILSTCEYTFKNARFIVLAKLVPVE